MPTLRTTRPKSRTLALVATACVLFVAVCGGAASQASARSHKQTIVVWQFWSGFAVGLQPLQKKLDAEFEARYPQYTVNDVPISFTQMGTKLTAAIAAGSGPNSTAPPSGRYRVVLKFAPVLGWLYS